MWSPSHPIPTLFLHCLCTFTSFNTDENASIMAAVIIYVVLMKCEGRGAFAPSVVHDVQPCCTQCHSRDYHLRRQCSASDHVPAHPVRWFNFRQRPPQSSSAVYPEAVPAFTPLAPDTSVSSDAPSSRQPAQRYLPSFIYIFCLHLYQLLCSLTVSTPVAVMLMLFLLNCSSIAFSALTCLQCFAIVGWVPGRASGL